VLLGFLLLAGISRVLLGSAFANLGFVYLNRSLQEHVPQQSNLTSANYWFLRAFVWDQRNIRTDYGLGQVWIMQGRYSEAVQVLERAVENRPSDVLMHLALGDAYNGVGDRDRAIGEWQKDEIKRVLYYRGQRYEKNKEWEKASYWYMAAMEVDPNWVTPCYSLGQVRRAQEMLPEALYYLLRASSLAPDDPSIHHQLGLIYMSQGKTVQTIEEFEQTLQLAPNDMWTTIYLASLYLGQGDLDRTTYYALRASAQSQYPRSHYVLGTVYRQQGSLGMAIAEFEEAVRLASWWNQSQEPRVSVDEMVQYHLALAQAYYDTDRVQEAITVYKAVLILDPQNAPAMVALQRLEGK